MKWNIELHSSIVFETPDGYTEEEATANFFEELYYNGVPITHDYTIKEIL